MVGRRRVDQEKGAGGVSVVSRISAPITDSPSLLLPQTLWSKRALCFSSGMDDYITKPLDQKQLHALLERFLKKDMVNAPLAIRTRAANGGPFRTTSNSSDISI